MKRKTFDETRDAAARTLMAVAALAATSASPSAIGETPSRAGDTPRVSEVGQETSAWLGLQRSNEAAAPALPTLGAEAGLAYARYLNSFKTKIPGSFASPIETRGASFGDYKSGPGGSDSDSTTSN